jgi:delta11-fatty-acid desaturase
MLEFGSFSMKRRSVHKHLKPMKIHDKWYDMSGFAHPGGPIMLKLGESRDATAMFESHHPFTSRAYLHKLLKPREVDPAEVECVLMDPRDKKPEFEWPAYESKDPDEIPTEPPYSDFALELRNRVEEYVRGEAKRRGVGLIEATKPTASRWALIFALTALFLSTVPAFFRGEWWTVWATPITDWFMGVNVFHDGSHFGLSRDWRVNALGTYTGWWFSSPLIWYHQHVIGHHAYPNIPLRDPDLYHNGTMERHTKTMRHKPMHRHQHFSWAPIWFIGTFAMNFLKPMQFFASGLYNRAVYAIQLPSDRVYMHLVGRIFVFCLCHVWPYIFFEAGKATAFSIIPVGIVSLCFMTSSQVNHLTAENIDVRSSCFYKHQVLTSHSFGDASTWSGWLVFLFTGGLNLQIEHHLFPCVNHCHLPAIRPIVKAVCKKHGVFYHESAGLGEALGKYYTHMKDLSFNELLAEIDDTH